MPVRWKSAATLLEYPWLSIALGPDPANHEVRGHARGIFAIGDIATGVIAIGGVARGAIAFGGPAIGGIRSGGLSLSILGFGGLALGYIAVGGLAIGYAAIGGMAIGHYAMGGAPFGQFVIGPQLWRGILARGWQRHGTLTRNRPSDFCHPPLQSACAAGTNRVPAGFGRRHFLGRRRCARCLRASR